MLPSAVKLNSVGTTLRSPGRESISVVLAAERSQAVKALIMNIINAAVPQKFFYKTPV